MRLLSYLAGGKPGYGVAVDDGIVDLTRRIGAQFPDLRSLIAGDGLDAACSACAGQGADHTFDGVVLLPPIPAPEKLWCIGVNYRDRNAEYKDNSDLPKYPSLFVRNPSSVVGSGQGIEKPKISEQLDYEGELAIVIGKEGRHIPRERAFEHIFGMTLCNEGSVRDWLHHGKFNVTQGKNFDRSGSIGPWIVTADELDPRGPHDILTRVNGELRQQDSTERLMFPFDFLIAYLSTFATLRAGDMIATGTPTGAGARFNPPRWLKPMLDQPTINRLAHRLDEAERSKSLIRAFTQEHPDLTIEDAYAIQRAWTGLQLARGRIVKGHKIGLTSKAMQSAVGISEPDYGVLFEDMFYPDASPIPFDRFHAPRIEVELAFILKTALKGPDCTIFDVLNATDYVTPALEILETRMHRIDP
ncbi:MAG: fumarylacetoacetate hydrolase family protein, partial [Devosia sp.]